MPEKPPDNYRFSSGPIVKTAAGIVVAAIVGLIIVVIVTGRGIGLLLLVAAAAVTGLILERLDKSRKREPGSEGSPEDFWGFRGRPGS